MLFSKIKAEKDFLSKVERKIADIILTNPEKFINSTALEISRLAEVSQGSLNNFSKKFAGGGFSELKTKLATEMNDYKENFFNIVSVNDGIKDVMDISVKNIYNALISTKDINSEQALKKAADMIENAGKIEIYGISQSGIVAEDYAHQLLRIGICANAVTAPLDCCVRASMLDCNSLVIAISATGKSKDIYDAVKIAEEKNVPCICITRNKNSPIAKLCDEVLLVSAEDEAFSRKFSTLRLCNCFIIDTLCSYILYKKEESGSNKYFDVYEILASHRMEE